MKKMSKKMDLFLLLLMAILTIVGLVSVFSASSDTAVLYYKYSPTYFFKKQLFFAVVIWLFGMFFVIWFPTKKYRSMYIYLLYFFGIIVLLAVTMVKGVVTNSARSWLSIGPITIQPSEFFKSALIIFLGCYYEKIIQKKKYNYIYLLLPIFLSILPVLLIYKQPDLGTALIVLGILGLVILFLPINNKKMNYIKIGGILSVLVVFLSLFLFSDVLLTKEQQDRLHFKNPCTRYTEKTGYQVCNGFIAISNGGLIGSGLGNSTQKHLYLPEAYTDFIFPVIIEEIGVIGGGVIILLFILLLFRLLKIAKESYTIRGSIIAYGTFSYIILHLLVNFLGITALIPLTGVPVPFLSYGGSFLINLLLLLFINERTAIENKQNKEKELLRRI